MSTTVPLTGDSTPDLGENVNGAVNCGNTSLAAARALLACVTVWRSRETTDRAAFVTELAAQAKTLSMGSGWTPSGAGPGHSPSSATCR